MATIASSGNASDAGDAPVQAEAQPLSMPATLRYGSGQAGAGAFVALNLYILPLLLSQLGVPNSLIGWLSNQHSFEGVIIQPLVGAWSDRTWTRFGRRRAFIVWFLPFSVIFLLLMPFVPQFAPVGHALGLTPSVAIAIAFAICIFLFSLFFNLFYDPYQALLPDITPTAQRGRVYGISQALYYLGNVGLLLAYVFAISKLNLGFYIAWVVGALMVLCFLPVVFGVKEPRALPGVVKHQRYSLGDYWRGLTGDPQVLRYFLAMFILTAGIAAITPFIAIYARSVLHFGDDAAILAPLVILLSTALFVWPFGALADRVGLKRTFTIGILLMSAAAIAGIFARDQGLFYGVLALAGIGNAAQIAAAFPMLTRIANPDQMGLYTGILYGVTSIVGPGMGVLAGLLLDTVGAVALFPLVAALFCASLIPLAFLRIEQSQAAIALAELKARQAQGAA